MMFVHQSSSFFVFLFSQCFWRCLCIDRQPLIFLWITIYYWMHWFCFDFWKLSKTHECLGNRSVLEIAKTQGAKRSGNRSHKSSNRKLCGSYMYYLLSGNGVAWSVMFELRIDLSHTRKGGSSSHQYCTEEGHATVHTAWFHGVAQDDWFPTMHIWPMWNPDLELKYEPNVWGWCV